MQTRPRRWRSSPFAPSPPGACRSPRPRIRHRPRAQPCKGTRRVFEEGAWRDVPVWDREALPPEDRITGPALVEEPFATHWIARGWTATLGAAGALIARSDA
ncbi:hypothetical protein [Dankookia sp. P2]|uniref:hypothetical protein n=1 Tax=Dankookia sp. P2 TaxID=3423955 RepID=UPI003D67EB00